MAKDTDVRHVAVAVVYDEDTRRILMVTSRKHDDLWIREEILPAKRNHG
jgi:diphosphoinositol-polyphosphate diphosphatase